ncbi:uncharacterized protein MELLADRAFT_103948 [Melampsora larici-populina 98AG31]|uniref:Uncharacterized protein n=1 Tax=Melampsora larici-populina (strain 98AG31 / pathotype 3-4-7) TaxID=747676 RepID=F4RD34_MELLP|nr:uncharacterized protein MELLADRAFT_103948 [Melampsora larici-populina 98AG31]EGG09882.1 hypothetical protein MELLADRAFT_103948 [Melampsora larici-populina 98AG31]
MVNSPYIGTKYRRLAAYPTLPLPAPDGDVGLSCPDCPTAKNTSLVYGSERSDTKDIISVRCPTRHFYRTFKINQLIHEIGCINAGGKYPIPYDPSAHGPPVNSKGMTLPPPTDPIHSKSSTSTRSGPQVPCARATEGPTAEKHKVQGHSGCTHKYCKQCCLQYGTPGGCYVHRVKGGPPAQLANPANPAITPARVRVPPPANPPVAKRTRILPPQCAQSVRRVGHIVDEEGETNLATGRETVAARKESAQVIDTGKVISLHLVTSGSKSPVISQYFKDWPLAVLNDSRSLLRASQAAAGQEWTGDLVVWDEELRNWREIGVTLPHTYVLSSKNLVICLPHQFSSLAVELQDVLEGLQMGKPLVPKPQTNSNTALDKGKTPTFDKGPPPALGKGKATAIQRQPPVTRQHGAVAPAEGQSKPNGLTAGQHATSKPRARPIARLAWGGRASLLDARMARVRLWKARYGTEYHFTKQVYRYAGWVNLVGYARMFKWWQEWPAEGRDCNKENLTVAVARPYFQTEFNAVCNGAVATPNPQTPQSGSNI